MDESQPDATRAFSLLRKLAKDGKQSAEETHELIELIRAMASINLVSQIEAKLDALDTKYKVLIWVVGLSGGVISLLIAVAMIVLGR